jgi:hypothetical protein
LERNSEGSANLRKRRLEEDKDEEQEGEDDEQSEEEEQDDEESDEDGIVLAGLENDTIRLARHRKSRKSIPKPNMPFQKKKLDERKEQKKSNKARKISHESSATSQFKEKCSICLDDYILADLANISCGHNVCAVCVTTAFEMAAICEGSYPPKCCNRIELEEVETLLDQGLVLSFKARMSEWDTKPDQRMYCFQSRCSAFIPPAEVEGDRGKCPSCSLAAFIKCKKEEHKGECAGHDEGEEEVRRLSADEGWQECGNCALVELAYGCNHMT